MIYVNINVDKYQCIYNKKTFYLKVLRGDLGKHYDKIESIFFKSSAKINILFISEKYFIIIFVKKKNYNYFCILIYQFKIFLK